MKKLQISRNVLNRQACKGKVYKWPVPFNIGSSPADPGRRLFAVIAAASGGGVFDWTTRAVGGRERPC